MIITKEEIEAVLAGCDGVTPGPWGVRAYNVWTVEPPRRHVAAMGWHARDESDDANAAHIARLSPEFVRELAALALEALSSREAGWQPIETAPKDGTLILAICMRGDKGRIGTMAVDRWHTASMGGFNGFGRFNEQFWPATHWMPLPTPPDQETEPQPTFAMFDAARALIASRPKP